jgi:hypothetical protein
LVKEKLPISLPEFDVLDELRNVCVKNPLLQVIKDIPIYTKAIKELCSKKINKIRKDPPTIHVIENLAGLMSNTRHLDVKVERTHEDLRHLSVQESRASTPDKEEVFPSNLRKESQ